jgi:hypothetical protein
VGKLPKPDPPGKLASAFKEAMVMAAQMRLNGVVEADIRQGVENVLRDAWVKGREEPWHYTCRLCDDSGWQIKTCTNRSCGRPFKLPGQHSDDVTGQGTCRGDHTYAQPCVCERGQAQRRGLLQQRTAEDAVSAAAKTTTKFTRLGR